MRDVDLVVSLHVRIDENGTFWGEVAGLPGCFAAGGTRAELLEAAREAIAQYLAEPGAVHVTLEPVADSPPHDEQVTFRVTTLTIG